jgi:hypothetical protein
MATDPVRYTAVWEESKAGEIQVYGWTYADFRKKYDELWKQGWRLKLLEPFVLPGDQVRYTAAWEQSTQAEYQLYDATYDAFRKRYDELWKEGFRLKILQPYVLSGNKVRYTAVWRPSTAGEYQLFDATYDAFRKRYDELWKQGWRLEILQTYRIGTSDVRYTAVWRESKAGEFQLYGATYDEYKKRYDELWPKGWRLKALQPFVLIAPPKVKVPPPSPQKLVDRALQTYLSSGGVASAVGIPLGPVQVTGSEARWKMSGGQIVARQDGSTQVDVDQFVKVWFVGAKCFEESGEWSSKDEPYIVVSWTGNDRAKSAVYGPESMNKGDEWVAPSVLGDDFPVVTGSVHVAVYEHDEGTTETARSKVEAAMNEVARVSGELAKVADLKSAASSGTGTWSAAADIASKIVAGPVGKFVAKGIVAGLGLGDDYVGQGGRTIFGEEHGYQDYPAIGHTSSGEPYTHKFWVDSDGGGDYEVYLRVKIIDVPRPTPG